MLSHLRAIWTDESGQDLAEYALLLALIAIVVIVAVTALGPIIAQVFTDIATSLQNA
jgi:pilus assembly protein Flp/PilA